VAGTEYLVELDLRHELLAPSRLPLLRSLEGLVGERPVEETENLLELTAGLLHGLGEAGLRRVDHWEVEPGGWLALPEPVHPGTQEPIGHLRSALASPAWARISGAHTFSVRLSDGEGRRADATIRRWHRERAHSLSLGLYGGWREADVRRLLGTLRGDLPVLRARVRESGGAE
jgi:hypothetical protein